MFSSSRSKLTLFLEHIQHFYEIIVLEIPIRPRIHNDFKGLVNVKFVDDDQTDDKLGDNVQAVLGSPIGPYHLFGWPLATQVVP